MKSESTSLEHIPGVCGADEAGRGPLAGPVVAAAVILPEGFDVEGLDDSKKLDEKKRRSLEIRIRAGAIFAIEIADHLEIDRLNIFHASMRAMTSAVARLSPVKVFVDGNYLPKGITCEAEAVVKGDGKYACIAAASILAKNTRDDLMRSMAAQYPDYGFDRHFGYATPEHMEALRKFGPCEIHRRSFAPVRDWEQPCLTFDA